MPPAHTIDGTVTNDHLINGEADPGYGSGVHTSFTTDGWPLSRVAPYLQQKSDFEPGNCWPATSSSIACSRVLPACLASTVPRCVHLVFATHAINHSKVCRWHCILHSSKPRVYKPIPLNLCYNKPRIIFSEGSPSQNNRVIAIYQIMLGGKTCTR